MTSTENNLKSQLNNYSPLNENAILTNPTSRNSNSLPRMSNNQRAFATTLTSDATAFASNHHAIEGVDTYSSATSSTNNGADQIASYLEDGWHYFGGCIIY